MRQVLAYGLEIIHVLAAFQRVRRVPVPELVGSGRGALAGPAIRARPCAVTSGVRSRPVFDLWEYDTAAARRGNRTRMPGRDLQIGL